MKNKTVIIGDLHGSSVWKLITHLENPDRVVFIGDYFDSYDFNAEQQCNNYLDIIEYKKTSGKEVIMLIGNHDHHYIVGNSGTSGYQALGSLMIFPIVKATLDHLQMAYRFDDIVCTHAGIGEAFLDGVFGKDGWTVDTMVDQLNELEKYKPLSFLFNGRDNSGDDMGQTPIWIRPRSLMKDSQVLKKSIIQVVGHTQMKKVDVNDKSTGGRYFFIDTLGTSGEYLIVENEKITTGKI